MATQGGHYPARKLGSPHLGQASTKKGTAFLRLDDEYCCLGVFCSIQNRPTSVNNTCTQFDEAVNRLSPTNPVYNILDAFGNFHPCYIRTIGLGTQTTLAACNDIGLTFAQIADIIDEIWYDEKEEQP